MSRVYKAEFGIEDVPIKNSWDDMFEVNIDRVTLDYYRLFFIFDFSSRCTSK